MAEPAAGGGHDWVAAAMREHEASLLRYAARLTGDADLARDVTQDVFMRLCSESPAQLNGRLRPWLYTVCRNHAIELVRKRDRKADSRRGDSVDPAVVAETSEATSQVLRELAHLSANQQEVIRLRFEHGLSYKEIAAVTELTVSNVGVLIHTAIKTIRERIGD